MQYQTEFGLRICMPEKHSDWSVAGDTMHPGGVFSCTIPRSAASAIWYSLLLKTILDVNTFCCKCRFIMRGQNILFHVLTFAKPECDNVLQPEPRTYNRINSRVLAFSKKRKKLKSVR